MREVELRAELVEEVLAVPSVDEHPRLADALETERPFRIQVAGERIRVPARAVFSVEHEREEGEEEIEFQLSWTYDAGDDAEPDDDEVV